MYCPHCGQAGLRSATQHEFRCDCGFHYFHNVAASVAAILQCGEEILVTRRARDPGSGLQDFPGGFVDPGETLEAALVRELREELNLDIEGMPVTWLGSATNRYTYDGITYPTCDSYFLLVFAEKPVLESRDDVAAHAWVRLRDLMPADFAFSSSRSGIDLLNAHLNRCEGGRP
jgi:8-oxo-dGTP pyrophosphatase MutT (NUDIX family)